MDVVRGFFQQHYDTSILVFICLCILLAFYIAGIIISKYLLRLIGRIISKSSFDLDEQLLMAFEIPLRSLLMIIGVYYMLRYLNLPPQYDQVMIKLLRSFVVIFISWGIYRLAGMYSFLSDAFVERMNLDQVLLPFVSKITKFLIICLAFILVAHEWDYDVNGFIAGLGLGGLAFALAAKDMLANIFGGIVIIMEKPFAIGDWVLTPSVEGTVEEISFRSTRFRTSAQALVTVPNSTLANEALTNWSRMGKRRINFYVGLTYSSTAEQVQEVIAKIKTMLQNHPGIHPETIMVRFEKFSESSLDILVNCFTNTTVWDDHLAVREDLNLKIMNILEEVGVSMAFPSRSIFLENWPPNKEENQVKEED